MWYVSRILIIGFFLFLLLSCGKAASGGSSTITFEGEAYYGGVVSGAQVEVYAFIGAGSTQSLSNDSYETESASTVDSNSANIVGTGTTDSNGNFSVSVDKAYESVPIIVKTVGGTVQGQAVSTLEVAVPSMLRAFSLEINSLTTLSVATLKDSTALSTALASASGTSIINSTIASLVEQQNGQWMSAFSLGGDIYFHPSGSSTSATEYALAVAAVQQIVAASAIGTIAADLAQNGVLSGGSSGMLTAAITSAKTANPGLASVTLTVNSSPVAIGTTVPVCTQGLQKTSTSTTFQLGISSAGASSVYYQVSVTSTGVVVVPGTTVAATNGGALVSLTLPTGGTYSVLAYGVSGGGADGPSSITQITITPP